MRKEVILSHFQKEFIDRREDSLLILSTGISAGKSKVAGLWCVMETILKPCRIIAAAQNFKSLSEVLFREIKYWLDFFDIKYQYKFGSKFTLQNGSEIFGASAENPEGILGFTDISAAIIDEAAYCPEELYHYIGDRMRGDGIKPKYRLISSPSNQQKAKWFTDLCFKHPDCVIHATALDNPFTSNEFKQSLKDRYGVGSALYRQQVLGEFIETDTSDALITVDKFASNRILYPTKEYFIGCDIARFGVDRTCIVMRNNAEIVDMRVLHQADTSVIASNIRSMILGKKVHGIYLDGTGGYSSGVFDTLKLELDNIYEINFGGKSPDTLCANNRAFMYRELKNAIEEGFYVNDSELRGEICAQRLKLNNNGLFQLVPKENVKDYLGKSPDLSDALALSFYSNPIVEETTASFDRCHELTNILFR